jgi:hypothetical protein
MRFYKCLMLICILSISAAVGCGKNPLVSDLTHNKLIVILKGTYESGAAQPWAMPGADVRPDMEDDSVINVQMPGVDTLPGAFMLDISDMELLDAQGARHKFSINRQAHAMSINSNDLDPFFNGTGLILENDDVPDKYYLALFIIVRKMLFDGAVKYNPQAADPTLLAHPAWNPQPFFDTFRELAVPGLNFNQLQTHAFYDSLRLENFYINRVFPVVIGISGLPPIAILKKDSKLPYVLEVRIVIKNFIKKYEIQNADNGLSGYVHFYALSDWLHDVQAEEAELGGNLLSIARFYALGQTGQISGKNNRANAAHVIAVPHGSPINSYTIPASDPPTIPPSGNLRKANPCNLPRSPGLFVGDDIAAYLDFLLRLEKFKNDWSAFFPQPGPAVTCNSFDMYETGWNNFSSKANNFSIPPLAVYVPSGGAYTIDTISPGSYDLYISKVAPTYGKLYLDNQFSAYSGNPVNVGIGQDISGIDFP